MGIRLSDGTSDLSPVPVIAFALLCAALIGLIVYLLRHAAAQEREWARERQLLISRIQRPEMLPQPWEVPPYNKPGVMHPEDPEYVASKDEPDDIDLVGTVQTHGSDDSN